MFVRIKRQLGHSESANLRRRQNFNRKRCRIRVRIFGLIRIWMTVRSVQKCCGCAILSASVISPLQVLYRPNVTDRQTDGLLCRRLYDKWTSTIPQWWRKRKSDPESTRRSGSPPIVNHFQRVTSCLCLLSLVGVRFRVRQGQIYAKKVSILTILAGLRPDY